MLDVVGQSLKVMAIYLHAGTEFDCRSNDHASMSVNESIFYPGMIFILMIEW